MVQIDSRVIGLERSTIVQSQQGSCASVLSELHGALIQECVRFWDTMLNTDRVSLFQKIKLSTS